MPDPRDLSVCNLLLEICQAIARTPDELLIGTEWHEEGASLTIHARRDDLTQIIGTYGITIEAIRALIRGIGMKSGRRYSVYVEQ